MEQDLVERAKSALHDYALMLESRNGRGWRAPTKRMEGQPRRTAAVDAGRFIGPTAEIGRASKWIGGVNLWEAHKKQQWRSAGRLAPDGRLRVDLATTTPWTLQSVAKLWPHLGELDVLAATIDLDGVVEEDYMKAHDNIRAVVEKIADERMAANLSTGDSRERIKELIDEAVGEMFGVLLNQLKSGRKPGARGTNKCSNCGVAGHRVTTCTVDKKGKDTTN